MIANSHEEILKYYKSELTYLRRMGGVFAEFLMATDTDMPRLREMIGARLLPDNDPLGGQELPADAGAEAALRVATAEADVRRREGVSPLYLIKGILSQEHESGARLLAAVGMNRALVVDRLDPAL